MMPIRHIDGCRTNHSTSSVTPNMSPTYLATHARYDLDAHSIRKFFRTQVAALGVQADYIEYMMGHTISTYHDIKMKGAEYLRGMYVAPSLSIKPKTRVSKIDALKEIIRAWDSTRKRS